MSREVRMVPANWEHPRDELNRYIPLYGRSFSKDAAEWDEKAAQWEKGFYRYFEYEEWKLKDADMTGSFIDQDGWRPNKEDYMPDWSDAERTHYQMYETVTEGTPISPVMESPEALARWLADNKESSYPFATTTYEQWLAMIKVGFSLGSFVADCATGEVMDGVEAISCLK